MKKEEKLKRFAWRNKMKICDRCEKYTRHKQFNKICNECIYYLSLSDKQKLTYKYNWFT
jgi:hypothetical protein